MTLLSTSPVAIHEFERLVLTASDGRSKTLSSTTPTRTTLTEPSHDDTVVDNSRDDDSLSPIRTLTEFSSLLSDAIRHRKEKDIAPGCDQDPVCHLFQRLDIAPSEWQRYQHWNADKAYTRNLVATDHDTYTLLLLCWNPGRYSPIHDHPCDACWMQVLQGSVRECRYQKVNETSVDDGVVAAASETSASERPGDGPVLKCVGDATYTHNQLTYITDSMGYHKIGNPSVSLPAVTLHLYSPPFSKCRTWACASSQPQINECANIYDSQFGCDTDS